MAIVAQQLDGVAQEVKSFGEKACSGVRGAATSAATAVGKGAYHSAFGIAYGLVASGKFVSEIFHEKGHIRRGLVDGAESALGTKNPVKKPVKKTVRKAPVKAAVKAKVLPKKPAARTAAKTSRAKS